MESAVFLIPVLLLLGPPVPTLPYQSPVPNCFPVEAGVGEFETRWFCTQLQAAGEARLIGDSQYRFTYLPTFDAPRVVVVAHEGQDLVVVGKVLSGKGGYEPGKVTRSTRRKLTADEVRLLEQRLENAGMWKPTDRDVREGLDGSEWLLEGRHGARYVFHKVWSPTAGSFPQYRQACVYMLQLAGIKPEPGEAELY